MRFPGTILPALAGRESSDAAAIWRGCWVRSRPCRYPRGSRGLALTFKSMSNRRSDGDVSSKISLQMGRSGIWARLARKR
jgi:hypothetical protein